MKTLFFYIQCLKDPMTKMNQVTIVFLLQVTCLYCAPINLLPQIQQSILWPQLPQSFVHQGLPQPLVHMPQIQQLPGQQGMQQFQWPALDQPSVQLPQIVPVEQEMLEAEQVALQQQMMALQQWQVLQKLITTHTPVPM